MTFRVEEISPIFTKYHLEGPWPFAPVLHKFTDVDNYYPHDHPWGFTSHVLKGGYVEEVYVPYHDGTWDMIEVERLPGTSHTVKATHIHRMVKLLDGEAWTLVLAGPEEREFRFWEFDQSGYRSWSWRDMPR